MSEDRSVVADRIIAAYEAVARWAAQDFKRTSLSSHVTQTQFTILTLVDAPNGMSISQLAERLALSVPTVVRAVDALERKGYVQRERQAGDGRVVVVVLTREGRRMHGELDVARRARVMRLLEAMSEEEVDGLVRGYEGMARATMAKQRRERVG